MCPVDDSSNVNDVQSILWADAELESVGLDDDSVPITVTESIGACKVLTCEGYIGFEFLGLWDEMVISEASVTDQDPLGVHCIDDIKQRLGNAARTDTGSPERNSRKWSLLRIEFSDGLEMKVVAARFVVAATLP